MAAYGQFASLSTLSHRAVILIVDNISNYTLENSADAFKNLKHLVSLPMGVIIPGFAGSIEEGYKNLKIFFGDDANNVFPDLRSAYSGVPELVSGEFPCAEPSACSVLSFVEEATTAIGNTAKLNFLLLAQRLVNTVVFNPNQRFSIALFGKGIYKNIEPQLFAEFNATLNGFIETINTADNPNGGQTYYEPILDQTISVFNSGLYKHFSILHMGETE